MKKRNEFYVTFFTSRPERPFAELLPYGFPVQRKLCDNPDFRQLVPFAFLRDSLRGAILGASNPQNRGNAPENPQAGDFRERSPPNRTTCLLCKKGGVLTSFTV